MTLGSVSFATVSVSREQADFFADYLGQQLTLNGARVISSAEVAAIVGVERQKQMLGCSDNSACVIELASALGVDGLVTGQIAKLGATYVMNIKVVSSTGKLLAIGSVRADSDKDLLDALNAEGRRLAGAVSASTGKPLAALTAHDLDNRNVLSLNPGALILRILIAEYERALTDRWSLVADAMFAFGTTLGGGESTGLGIALGAHWYPWATAPRGFFVRATLAGRAGSSVGGSVSSLIYGGLKVGVGYSFLIRDVFYLSLGVTVGPYVAERFPAGGGAPQIVFDGPEIEPRLALGLAF